jgi:DNA end-binding protein Ku
MAVQLAEMGATEEFHPEEYRDEVSERVRALIQRKIEGEEITSADADEQPKAQVIDLMEALRASLANPKGRGSSSGSSSSSKPAKIAAKAEEKRKPAKPADRRAAAQSKARAK